MERYEEWDVSIPPIPPRSRLYRLEPIGLGTPYVESLTSYIARLAEEHHVTPKSLIMREMAPLQSHAGPILHYYSSFGSFWLNNALALNGIGSQAKQWVDLLQTFTTCDNLRFLTMLTWGEVIGMRGLLRRKKAWCPVCYEEWRQDHHTIYEPLLWALASINICLKHRLPLITSCPYCQTSLPFLNQFMRLGYCSHCKSWLGDVLLPQAAKTTSNEREEIRHQNWAAEAVGELLADAPTRVQPPQRGQIATMLRLLLEHDAKGNISALARLGKVNITRIWSYIRQANVPHLDLLLRLCSALSITPLEFLTTNVLPSQRNRQYIANDLPAVSRGNRKLITGDDVQRMRQVLEAVLAEEQDPSPNLVEVAESLGYCVSTIRKYCPDLSKRVSARFRRHWTEDDEHRMKQELENALKGDEPISLSAVAQRLGCDTSALRKRFPDLCRAVVTRYHERIDYKQIQRRLQEVLASETEAISVNELAQEMGHNRHVLWDNFPDLCNQITERRSTTRRKHHEERVAAFCNEIREAVLFLHNQGIYPNAELVSKQLNDPQAIRIMEGHEAWRMALEELGYETGHLKKYFFLQ